MLPKNSKHYILPTSEKLNIKNTTLVEDVVSFYFSEVRKSLSNLEHQKIKIENFGSFKIKPNELTKLRIKYSKHLEVLDLDNPKHQKIKRDLDPKLSKVLKLQAQIKQENQRQYEFNLKKNGNNSQDN